jgi:hypothetical protein
MTYRVEDHFLSGMPRTPRKGERFRLIAAHDTEGNPGYDGARATLGWMVSSGKSRNASYHEFWAWDAPHFVVIRAVPATFAAHSIAPQSPPYNPDALVKGALGTGWRDPNYWVYAVSIAGKVAQVNEWSRDPAFVAACCRRLSELRAELGVTAIAEHFRFQPGNRSDWGPDLTPAITEDDVTDLSNAVHEQAKIVRIRLGAVIYDDAFADTVQGTVEQDFDAELTGIVVNGRYLARRVDRQGGGWWVGLDGIVPDSEVPYRRATYGSAELIAELQARIAGAKAALG